MSKLTKEQYNELPEFLKSDYVEDGDGYSHAGFLKVKKTADSLDEKGKLAIAELEEIKKGQEEAIEKAKQEAYEKAKAEGDIETVTARHKEQLEDAAKRAFEEGKSAASKEFKELEAAKTKENLALKIASSVGIDEFAIDMMKAEIQKQIEVNPEDGSITYLDSDGRATSLDGDNFKAELIKNPRYGRLIKADLATNGGGASNGGGNGGSAPKGKKWADFSDSELVALHRADPAAYEQLKQTR